MNKLPLLSVLLLPLLATLRSVSAQEETSSAEYERLRASAEQHFADGSYELARRLYVEAAKGEVPEGARRWLEFRLADTAWRSQAATKTSDSTPFDQARAELERLVAEVKRSEDRDRVWLEAQESLGDLHWNRRQGANWGMALPHYQLALGAWAQSSELELARERYLGLVWRMARPAWFESGWTTGYYGNYVPLDVLRNARRIARGADERARSAYLLAQTLVRQGGYDGRIESGEALQSILDMAQGGERTEWYDDALFQHAEWLKDGVPQQDELGNWTNKSDFVGAVAAYRRLLDEFRRSETRYWDDAQNRLRELTGPQVDVSTSNAFLPGSEVQVHLGWRNVGNVELTLYPLDLTRQPDFSRDGDQRARQWIHEIDTARLEPARRWTHATGDEGRHVPGGELLTLDPAPDVGAWLLVAEGGGQYSRALILVSDTSLILKSSGTQVLAWYCNVENGQPVGQADVVLWRRFHDSKWSWKRMQSTTDADGLALFTLGESADSNELFAAASFGKRQAFAIGHSSYRYQRGDEWKAYAFTDRPAYRPLDAVSWKLIARSHDGRNYETPAGATIEYTITDPRGADVESGSVELNEFGAAWGELETSAAMPLGQYQIQLTQVIGGDRRWIAGSPLFRLEEYKLPEFEVSVAVPEVEGVRPLFRVGDEVTAEIAASYYFGGPVANAKVEVVVYQRPHYEYWPREHEFSWYFQDEARHSRRGWGGPGDTVLQTTVTTDAEGHAQISFPTPRGGHQDFEYTIEARVTDSSRREVIGQGTVRVTRNAYRAKVTADHRIYQPGDDVEVAVRTVDANGEPVAAKGYAEVTRQTWNPDKGAYDVQQVERTILSTDAEGNATLRAKAPREGYYQVRWAGEQERGARIVAETTVWVCSEETRRLGYHHGGVEILLDSDTFRVGERVPVMISTPASGRWVLVAIEREELLSYQVLHLTGDVKLMTLDVTEEHVPNLYLSATLLHDGQVHMDNEQVVVPPVRQFLEIDVSVDSEEYEPGAKGSVEVCVSDHEGKPVRGEIALTLFDESVTAIQSDLAGDPRAFFYGDKRPHLVQTSGSFNQLQFIRLVKKDGEIVDQATALRQDEREHRSAGVGGRSRSEMSADGSMLAARKSVAAPAASRQLEGLGYSDSDAIYESAANFADGGGAGGPAPRVRSNFSKTALWKPSIITDEDGCATLEVTYPDSLTRWVGKARVQSAETHVGIGEVRVRTRMPLMARLQAPRFFQVGDELVLSGILNNQTSGELSVRAQLDCEGLTLLDAAVADALVPAGGEQRVDWRVRVEAPGEAQLTLSALNAEYSDAMEKTYPVFERGAEVFIARTGKFDSGSVEIALELPSERRPGSTEVTVDVTPSLAVTMLDALPYLVEYPYGCTEQTLSRFMPATVVAKTLGDLGLSPEIAMNRVFGGIEREHVDKTHPANSRRRSLDQLDDVTASGLERLMDFQRGDGGWGWWKGGESDLFMSAYAVWGLALAKDAGVDVPTPALERGRQFLSDRLVEAENRVDLRVWMLHALATTSGGKSTQPMLRAFDEIWEERGGLNAYTRALFALSAHALGRGDEAAVLVDNLVNGVKIDETPDTSIIQRGTQNSHANVQGTAHWGSDGIFWRWSEGGVEATATVLRALLTIAPEHELVDPVVQWLVRNRRGASWSNTRDTAMVVLALDQYLQVRGELEGEAAWEVVLNGEVVDTRRLSGDQLLAAPTRIELDPELLSDGVNHIQISRISDTPLYFACYAKFFSTEQPIPPHGSEVFVRREYFRIVPKPTLLAGPIYEKVRVADGDPVASGERVEVVLTLESKNDLEYLLVEDFKPAGFESVELQSGGAFYARELRSSEVQQRFGDGDSGTDKKLTGRSRWVHREMRDRHTALFVDRLPEGVWEMRFELRAEIPGTFSALPTQAHAMYVPEIRANSAEWRMQVTEN